MLGYKLFLKLQSLCMDSAAVNGFDKLDRKIKVLSLRFRFAIRTVSNQSGTERICFPDFFPVELSCACAAR